MTNEMIRVLAVRPHEMPEVIEMENTLEAKQKFVGGWIEMCTPYEHKDTAVIICNEEGKLMGLEPNRPLYMNGIIYDVVCGNFLIVDVPEDLEDFGSLSDEQIEKYTYMYSANMDW